MSKSIAILAHVDAGKTTLSERILYLSKEIDTVGEVEEGLATMDYLPTEKEKGITIETGVSSYTWKGEAVDFLDTPGHIDFSAEVDCALYAAQGAVLVVCGQNSLETQTLSAWSKITQHNVTPLVFVNKLDIEHSDLGEVLIHIEEQIDRHPIALNLPVYNNNVLVGVFDLISNVTIYSKSGRKIEIDPDVPTGLEGEVKRYRKELIEALAEYDDDLMERYLLEEEVGPAQIIPVLSVCFQAEKYIAVCMGSAKQSIGVRQLLNSVQTIFPQYKSQDKNVCSILKVRTIAGQGLVYIAQAHSKIDTPDWCSMYSVHSEELHPIESIEVGMLFTLKSEIEYVIGDSLDENGEVATNIFSHSYNPLVMVQIEAHNGDDTDSIDAALKIISKTDPSLKIVPDYEKGSWSLFVVGEVHLDYICDRLKKEFRCNFECGEPQVQYYEELNADIKQFTQKSEIDGTILSLDLEIRRLYSKNYSIEIDDGEYPQYIEPVIESALDECVKAGVHGKGEIRCAHFVFSNIQSSGQIIPGHLKKLVLDAIRLNIKTENIFITQPIMQIEIGVPTIYCGKISSDLQSRSANIQKLENNGVTSKIIGEIPLTETFGYSIIARTLTKGTASYALSYRKHK